MSDDVIDGNVGTEYDEIDESTIYFDGVPPKWTYEKLKELYDKGEREGNIDVSSRGEILNKLETYDSGEEVAFVRSIPIVDEIAYRIIKSYWKSGTVFERRHIVGDFKNHKGHFFVPFEKSYDEAKELVQKLLDSDFYKALEGEEDDA